MRIAPGNLVRRFGIVAAAALTVAAGSVTVAPAQPAAAIEQPDTIDLDALDMVPQRMWGVSGQNPADTQTESLDNLVWDFAQSGNRMFVGGAFLNVQENKTATPIVQSYVAAFDIDTGDWISSWTPQIDRAVYSLEVLPNGSVLVGGEFESVNGQARKGVVALDPLTGAIDPSFTGSVDRPWSTRRAVVRDLQIDGDRVYVAGNFSHLDGINGSRTRVYKAGRFNPIGVIDPTWKPEITGSGVWGFDTDQARGEVTFSGFFSAVNGEPNTGNFHTVDDTTGATVAGKLDLPRNQPNAQPEMFDATYGDGVLFAIGEQHIVQVLDAGDQSMLGYHHTGIAANTFTPSGYFSGGAYQFGERIGDIVFSGCHCTRSIRNGNINHFSSFTGVRTPNRLVMAYEASTGRLIDSFMPDINSPRDGTWAVASDTNGCLYIGGDLHVGGVDAGQSRWLGGFAKLCGGGPRVDGLLIESGSDWRYDDSGADLGTAWSQPGFDDAAWATGNGELGFGDGDEATIMNSGNVTYYARKTFEFTGAQPPSLDLRLKADDGAVVYLNGVEIARDNLPAGQITAATPASGWRSGASEDFMEHVVRADSLVEGTNVLAVEIHNVWSGNNDLGFDARLGAADTIVEIPQEPLVEIGSTWNYIDSGNAAPAGWPAAVVAGPAASAQMGFGEGDEATVLTAGQEAYYFSHEFQVADAAAFGQLKLSLLADDGAVVFLNGTEIHRFNMPDGDIGFGTRPQDWVGTADEIYMDTTVAGDALVDGTNLLTVEVHNFWPGNPDLSFDAGLELQP